MRFDYLRSFHAKVRRRISTRQLRSAQNEILSTPKLRMQDAPLRFLSMVSHRDLCSYICAIKSIYRFVGEGQVIVINDGSLDTADQAVIRSHLPLSTILDIRSIDVGRCPNGGTWERLVRIVDETADNYVIQLDADTLAVAEIADVVEAYRQNRSFLLGTDMGQAISPLTAVATLVREQLGNYMHKVGCLAEAVQAELPNAHELRYCRASSGFAGFAKGAFERQRLQDYSVNMEALLGERWQEWGTEQIASNFMIANAPDTIVLPFAKYACFEPWIEARGKVFLHFIGTFRTRERLYESLVRSFVAKLRTLDPASENLVTSLDGFQQHVPPEDKPMPIVGHAAIVPAPAISGSPSTERQEVDRQVART